MTDATPLEGELILDRTAILARSWRSVATLSPLHGCR